MSGLPPCRRCVEQQLECVLAKSRRGGRRVKGVRNSAIQPANHTGEGGRVSEGPGPASTTHDDDCSDYQSGHSSHSRAGHQQGEASGVREWPSSPQHTAANNNWRADSPEGGSAQGLTDSRTSSDGLEGHIASTDLLNPSDALDLLAQVADLDPGRPRNSGTDRAGASNRNTDGSQPAIGASSPSFYPPLADGILTPSEATYLVKRYVSCIPIWPVDEIFVHLTIRRQKIS